MILEFFGARCPPCWVFHETHLLEDLYQEYGPDGSDELVVISIEVNVQTGLEELMGENDSEGDFVTGISYPIINDEAGSDLSSIVSKTALLYGMSSVPNLFVICPNRLLTKHNVRYLDVEQILEASESCIALSSGNDVYLLDVKGMEPTCENDYNEVHCIFYNNGTTDIENLNIAVYKDEELQYSQPWVGSMSSYEYDTIQLSAFQAHGTEFTNYEVKLEWSDDAYKENNDAVFEVNPIIADSRIIFEIERERLTPWNREEWSMVDQDGNEIFRLSSDSLIAGISTYEIDIPSSVSCLYYVSDAKSFYPEDKIIITNAEEGQILIFQDSTGLREFSEYVLFHSGYSDVLDIEPLAEMRVYPTITTDLVNIESNAAMESSVEIFSLQGESLLKDSFTGHFHSQSLSHLSVGLYILTVSSKGNISSHYVYVSE